MNQCKPGTRNLRNGGEMPLDKVLINHLDEMDTIEDGIDEAVERLIMSMSIDALIQNPEGVLSEVALAVEDLLKEEYYVTATENGAKLAKAIEDDGDIKIQKTKDPNINDKSDS
ncbi:MAG: hypothetical protein EOL91_13150 [Actinobacteria bacterium]|nr:hypothetical protein [Actinomycetota bacterium]